MTDQTSKEEEKIWDKSWSYNDMKNNSTSWSLAGDSGLLLRLKQFSENLISKSVEIEKKLQKLNHTEQQCLAKLNNATSNFLLLENTQFIENRVYEHEITESKAKETTVKKEKTKEEKELELVNKMNEAVTIGMSIMDTYFEKLDPKQTKNESDQDDDDDDEDKNGTETNDTFIYETKDPYVLRSLPYLIGSQAFLDNDHVGLKDLDSEEEDEEEEEDNEVEEQESETESKHSNEDEDKSQLFSPSKEKSRKISDSNTSSSSDDEDDDDDLFKPKATNKNKGLFDDDDDSSEEDHDNQQEVKQPEMFDKDQEEPTPPKVVAPPVIDFASELSARLANKQNNIVTSTATKQPSPKPAAKQPMQTSNLFDSSEEEDQDDNQIFKNTKTVPKSLFDDDEDEEEITPVKKVVIEPEIITATKTTMPKSDITSALNDLFAKKAKTKSFLSDEDDQDPLFLNKPEIKPLPTTVTSTKKNVSIFDDDEDDDFEIKKKPEPVTVPKQAPTKSIFDDDDEEEDALFAKPPPPVVTPSKPPVTQQAPIVAKKTTLFDSSTDSSPESNLEQAKPKRKSSDSANNKPKANLFGSSDESSTDLFSSTKTTHKQEATEQLFAEEANDSIPELQAKSKPAETVDKQNEKLKTKKSLFDSSTEDEGDDLFKISTTTRPPPPKPTIKKASLFDEEDDDLFKTKKEPVLIEPLSSTKEPVFKEPAIPVRKQTDEDLTSKLGEEKPMQSATPSKPVGAGKNMLFNPAALKNSNLFKKLAVQTKSSDESGESDTEVKPAEKKTPVLETPIKPPAMLENIDNFFTTSVPILPNAPIQPVLSNQNEDLFSDIKVDRAFGDNTLKNAQKDRIKATAGKKRSPANRRPIETTTLDFEDPFSVPIQSKEAVKPVRELTIQSTNQQKPSLFDSSDSSPDKMKPDNVKQEISEVNIRNNSMLLNFEQKITSRKSLENIFDDDDDDLFTTTTKPTVKQTTEPAKTKQSDELKLETEKKKETVSVFDNSLDDFDLFSAATSATTKKKKSEKKALDNIFDDDTDIFSDVANISSKKQVEEKKKPEITKPAKTNPNKKDLFANISDDDDIFSESSRTTTTKKKDDSKKSKTDKFDDPLNLFNV